MLKVVLGAVILCMIETINGIFRVHFFTSYFGRKKAKIISFALGLIAAVFIMLLFISWIEPKTLIQSIGLGLFWAGVMAIYDIWVGRVLFKLSWEKIFADFNPKNGNLLSFGILIIALFPSIFFYM